MAQEEHIEKLKEGIDSWNKWREGNPTIEPDLSEYDFTIKENVGLIWDQSTQKANFENIDFRNAKLTGSKFWQSNLHEVDMTNAIIDKCDFFGCDLSDAKLILCKGIEAKFQKANLKGADFKNASLKEANFTSADLSNAYFYKANLDNANFKDTDSSFRNWSIGFLGEPKIPVNYPDTSLESITGLAMDTKRMLMDGIYLKKLWDNTRKKFRLRIWGITSGYGIGFTRWLTTSLIIILLFSFILSCFETSVSVDSLTEIVDSEGKTSWKVVSNVEALSFGRAIYFSLVTFTTLGFGDIKPITDFGRIMVCVEIFMGYVMLGGLVAIFTNRFSKLSKF